MDWLNLHIPSVLRSPEYVGSSPAERGTWLCVMAYACSIECGGRLVGAALWKDRQWQQTCGVTLREVRSTARLLMIDGDDVVVNGYPVAKEAKVKQARGVGMAGAMARWGNADRHADEHAETMPTGMPVANAEGEGEGEGKDKGKRKEKGAAAAAVVAVPEIEIPTALNTPAFSAAWSDWLAYRRERKLAAYKPISAKTQLSTLAEWGEPAAIEAIRTSIRQQWQGLFPPKPGTAQPKPTRTAEDQARVERVLNYQPGL